MTSRLGQYASVRLTADLAGLSPADRAALPHLIEAARQMDEIFWREASGPRDSLLATFTASSIRQYVEINYGPWDRLAGDEPFVPGVGAKPRGANFYPADMTTEEFEAAATGVRAPLLTSLYTLVRRDASGDLVAVPYAQAFEEASHAAATALRAAAATTEDVALGHYLRLRAQALETDDYRPSDLAWMDMKDNVLDIVIGPIETYEDQLFGYKAAHEAYVLIKDRAWSARLARFAKVLPDLQAALPVPEAYKQEQPGSESDLGAYDAVFYAGQANAGSKTIAINLPNDEEVQRRKGTRRLQLKNAMRAKFDRILVPLTDVLIDPDQRSHVTFDAFFANTMFHEVAHGLGIRNTITGKGLVRTALKERASALEEGKADVLGLYMVTQLHDRGDLPAADLHDNYVTFLGSIFRSIRFGASSAHARANLVRFNFFRELGAFTRDSAMGTYRVNIDLMQNAVNALSRQILTFQGDGDYEGVSAFVERYGVIDPDLEADLARVASAGIPTDVTFEQGMSVLSGTP